jgi:hypothetical protein
MTVNSLSVKAKDYYRIVAKQPGNVTAETAKGERENSMSGLKGSDNWGIAVSELAIALVSKKGTILQG